MSLFSQFTRFQQVVQNVLTEPVPEPPNEASIYKDLYTEMQFSQLELSRQFNLLMKEKEQEIRDLRTKLGQDAPPAPPTSSSTVFVSPSKAPPLRELSQEDFKVVMKEWERKLKSNIIAKTEAEAEARLLRQTVQMLQMEQKELKELAKSSFSASERENHAQAVLKMGEEFAKVQQDLELAREQLRKAQQLANDGIKDQGEDSTVDQLRAQMNELVTLNSATEHELNKRVEHEAQINTQLNQQLAAKREELANETKRFEREIAELRAASTEGSSSSDLVNRQWEQRQSQWEEEKLTMQASLEQFEEIKLALAAAAATQASFEAQQAQWEEERKATAQFQLDQHVKFADDLAAKEVEWQAERAELQLALNASKAELEQAQASVAQNQGEFNTQMDALRVELLQAKALQEETSKVLEAIEQKLANALQATEQAKLDLEAKSAQVDDLQGQVQQCKVDFESQATAAKQELECCKQELEQCTLRLSNAEMELSTAKQACDAAKQAESLAVEQYETAQLEMTILQGEVEELQHQVQDTQTGLDSMRTMFLKECALRRQVHDELMDLKGNIRIFARVRPPMPTESQGELIPLEYNEEEGSVVVNNQNRFEFDAVFDFNSTQEQVFNTVSPFLVSVMDGVNVTLLAYGQTGSGKTFTMQGSKEDPGVNTRSLARVFAIAEERSKAYEYTFNVSVLEIYLEQVLDLLTPQDALDIRIHPETKLNYCPGLTIRAVTCIEDVESVLALANKNRTTASHNMNEHSSRSHLVFALECVGTPKLGNNKKRLEAKLTLIDLAGSERVSKTDASGEQLKEAQAINKSLSALGDVINALGSGTGHVPFRNSKLTYLLQDQLSGSGKVGFFANCHPTMYNLQETVFTLKFAERCRKTELKTRKRPQEAAAAATTPSAKKKTEE